ncbi:MAG: 3-keto-disaccharide hydrolase [Pirellulaceae bacterium]
MLKVCLTAVLGLTLLMPPLAVAQTADDGWQTLFDGKSLDGWQPNERPENWTIEEGAIVGHGERSHLYYMGEQFENFEFQTEVMINEGGNSGIYLHIEHHPEGWFFDGHEVQINNSHADPVRTGSLWGVVKLYDTPVKDNEWFTVDILVKEQNIVVKVNGKIVVDYTEPEGAKGPRRLSKGYLALQQHDPGSSVRFRNIKVKRLP